jgi:transposase
MERRNKYDKEFKINAIRLCEESGKNQRDFEKEMGIGNGCISHWKRELRQNDTKAFPGNGISRDQEVARLKREIEILRQERDILKKAVGIFSKPTRSGMNS